ncbi:unnamed protein product [Gordionus sp. m RMFG-2023]
MQKSNLAKIKIIFFAQSRELIGKEYEYISIPCKLSYDHLISSIEENLTPLKILNKKFRIAKNLEYINENYSIILKDNDEIALITPIGGG